MIQWLKTRLGSDEDEQEDTTPEPEHHTITVATTVYEATVEYQNGDTETFECYGWQVGADTVAFRVGVEPYCCFNSPHVRLNHDDRVEHYEVLAREPETKELREEEYRIEWSTEWSKNGRGIWCESVDRDTIEMELVE